VGRRGWWGGLSMILWLAASAAPCAAAPVTEARYLECLAYQQAAPDPADPEAEACTWAIADYRRFHRFSLAVRGRLDDWLLELAADRSRAVALHPERTEGFPEFAVHVADPRPPYDSRTMEGRGRPIDVRAAEEMLAQVVFEEWRAGIPPVEGDPIRWSAAFHRRHPNPQFSRLLVTLTFGMSSRMLRTGREEALLAWLGAQPDDSVTLESLFRSAYRAADGDVYVALLTAENVLSRYWMDPDRDRLLFLRKLRPLVDTYENRGDHFGAWYHLFGTMLFGYARGGAAVWVAGNAEAIGSKISNDPEVVEWQEGHINRAGGQLGLALRRLVRSGDPTSHADDPSLLAEARYMDLDEFQPASAVATAPADPPPGR
jgi:hypothetical protein